MKSFTISLDIEIEAENQSEAIGQLQERMRKLVDINEVQPHYWLGEVSEVK